MIIEADEQGNWKISMAEYIEREKIWPALNAACVPYNRATQKAIESIPAADVRPVVRGKWIQDCDYHFRCSACGDRWTVSNGHPLDVANGWNYCPNCGADMRGEHQ